MRDDRLRDLLGAGALLMVLLSPTQHGLVLGGTHVSPVDPVLGLAFGLWCVLRLRGTAGGRLPGLEWLLPPIGLACSLVPSAAPLGSAKEIAQAGLYFVAAPAVFASVAADPAWRRRLVGGYLLAGAVVVLLGLREYADPAVKAFDVRSTFGNANTYGGFLAVFLPLPWAVVLFGQGFWWRLACLVLVAIALPTILSGGAMIAALLVLVFMAGLKNRFLPVLVLVAFGLAWPWAAPRLPRDNAAACLRSLAVYGEDGEPAPRFKEWQAGLAMWRERPLFGFGAGQYQEGIGSYYGAVAKPNEAGEPDSQNLYLVLLCSAGAVGLGGLLGFLAASAGRALRCFFRAREGAGRAVALAACGALLGFALASAWSALLVRGLGIPLVLLPALLAALETEAAPPSGRGPGGG